MDKPILSSGDVEIRKEILSPEVVKTVDKIKESQHASKERVVQDRKERESYIAPDGDVDIIRDKSAAQRGRVLQTTEIVRRLKRINPALIYEVSKNFPDIGAFYIIENRPNPLTNVSPWKRHICGIPNGEVWEFHRPLVIEEVIPEPEGLGQTKTVKVEGQVPGWRQILLALIVDGAIKPADAEKYFNVSQGRSSERWQKAQVN